MNDWRDEEVGENDDEEEDYECPRWTKGGRRKRGRKK